MTCSEFREILPDYLTESLPVPLHELADAHRLDCDECAAIVSDLRRIRGEAAALPVLSPSHDLWAGIEARIEAEVIRLETGDWGLESTRSTGTAVTPVSSPQSPVSRRWRLAAAATILVGATAGITWFAAVRSTAPSVALGDSATATGRLVLPTTTPVSAGSRPGVDETYGREIDALRKLVDARRDELDPATLGILEKNLKVIDQAISESRAALVQDPASALLLNQLTDAYDAKLQLLRTVAVARRS